MYHTMQIVPTFWETDPLLESNFEVFIIEKVAPITKIYYQKLNKNMC